jgi:hypothetical protein
MLHQHKGCDSHEGGPDKYQSDAFLPIEHTGKQKPDHSDRPDRDPSDTVPGTLDLFHDTRIYQGRTFRSISGTHSRGALCQEWGDDVVTGPLLVLSLPILTNKAGMVMRGFSLHKRES